MERSDTLQTYLDFIDAISTNCFGGERERERERDSDVGMSDILVVMDERTSSRARDRFSIVENRTQLPQ